MDPLTQDIENLDAAALEQAYRKDAAAFLQNLRSALQKAIKGRLSTTGAAYARFLYGLPFAVLYLWALAGPTG